VPMAAHITSTTDHAGGALQGTGIVTVTIGGLAAAVALDLTSTLHACGLKPPPPHPASTPVAAGSGTVSIGGFPAARVGDKAMCGATITTGATNIFIGD
jgi:uncharacterized Zn-binding protein involved in type VI secretion